MKELFFFEWVVFDNCNFRCSYCVNKGKYSQKEAGKMIYVPGRELDIARKIVELSRLAKKTVVNLTGGEPLLSKHIKEVVLILRASPHIKINLISNYSLIDRVLEDIKLFDSILVSLHINQRPDANFDRLIDVINSAKKRVPLTLSQVDHDLTGEDKRRLSEISSRTGLPITFQAFIPPWTGEGKVKNGEKISDATFVSSAGKRCVLGYFTYFLLPDGTYYYGLWCDQRAMKLGDFLAPLEENWNSFFPKDMNKCKSSSCGCNYNYSCYEQYLAECKRLDYPRAERFGRYNKRIGYVLRHEMRDVPAKAVRFAKSAVCRLLNK